jgi:anaerobic selenocysteine-containing dehydrogenase
MRGISAHSNGFQTARALHLLQILLGSVEVPGGYRFKPPYPKPIEAHPTPHSYSSCRAAPDGPHLGYVRMARHLALKLDDLSPARIDKGFTWENPLSAHGLMHMVIPNAVAGDPYPIDTLILYMANMAWNSSMNTAEVMEMLTEERKRRIQDPADHLFRRLCLEMVAYADLILPDTTYLERHDCISLLDRPICEADHAGDAIRWPVVEPDRDVRGFQSVLVDLGARLGPAGVRDRGRAAEVSRLCRLHRASPAPTRYRAVDGVPGAWRGGARGAQPEPVECLYRQWRVLYRRGAGGGSLLQAVEQGLSGLGGEDRLL